MVVRDRNSVCNTLQRHLRLIRIYTAASDMDTARVGNLPRRSGNMLFFAERIRI